MKKLFTVNIHSVVDIITNSSTEMFCSVKDTEEKILREVFQKILDESGCDLEFSIYQGYHYDEETDEETEIKGMWTINCERDKQPCKLLLSALREVFTDVIEGED